MTEYRGDRGEVVGRFAVVASRFNEAVTTKLLEGALACFASAGFPESDVDVAWVPGAFDIPLVARRLAASGDYAGVVCIGAVVRGETSHHEVVAHQSAQGIREAGRDAGIPVTLGVVTTEDLAQALDRAGGSMGNRGWDAAAAAIELASLLRRLPDAP
ncbi:MAG: 6,7-dimethyl-8-ribityllumazine synthase [Actinomycetota bacterium]